MNFFKTYKLEINKALEGFFQNYPCINFSESEKILLEGMNYAVMLGGKRIRPTLGLLCFELFRTKDCEVSRKKVIETLISLEFIHAYSLVHDDLPALDNDSLRRGQLSVWKKFGEAEAVLIGDSLQALAFENLAKNSPDFCIKKLIKILAQSSGIQGMVGGQIRDMQSENKKISEIDLVKMHQKKTGALLVVSAQFGAVLSNASDENFAKITKFAELIGLAFQIKDDLLDGEGDSEIVGKTVGKDEKGFVKILGVSESKKRLKKLIEEAVKIAQGFKSDKLEDLAKFVEEREK